MKNWAALKWNHQPGCFRFQEKACDKLLFVEVELWNLQPASSADQNIRNPVDISYYAAAVERHLIFGVGLCLIFHVHRTLKEATKRLLYIILTLLCTVLYCTVPYFMMQWKKQFGLGRGVVQTTDGEFRIKNNRISFTSQRFATENYFSRVGRWLPLRGDFVSLSLSLSLSCNLWLLLYLLLEAASGTRVTFWSRSGVAFLLLLEETENRPDSYRLLIGVFSYLPHHLDLASEDSVG